jgi:hypothetical protein
MENFCRVKIVNLKNSKKKKKLEEEENEKKKESQFTFNLISD